MLIYDQGQVVPQVEQITVVSLRTETTPISSDNRFNIPSHVINNENRYR
jgi:hypothetical protein